MKNRWGLAVLLSFCTGLLPAQNYFEIDRFLDHEKSYQSLFYLNPLKKDKSYQISTIRFQVNNRLIESHLINRSPIDSCLALVKDNEFLFNKIKDPFEKQYFSYNKIVLLESTNEVRAIQELSSRDFADVKLAGNAFLKTGDWLQNQRKFRESIEPLTRALKLFQKDSTRFYFKIFRAHYLLGLSYKNLSDHARAEVEYKSAFTILSTIPEPMSAERSKTLNNLGNIYNETGQYKLAKWNYLQSLDIKEHVLKDSVSSATTYNNLATFYMRFGNFSQAKMCYSKSLKLMRAPKSAQEQMKYNTIISNYSALLREFGEFSTSQQEVMQAMRLSEMLLARDHVSLIRLKLRMIVDAISLDDLPKATSLIGHIKTGLANYPIDDPIYTEYEITLSNYLFKVGQYDSCYKVCANLLKNLAQDRTAIDQLFYTIIKTGNTIEKTHSMREALPYYERAYQMGKTTGQLPKRMQGLNLMASAYLTLNQLDSVEKYTKQLLAMNFVKDSLLQTPVFSYVDTDIAIESFERLAKVAFIRYHHGNKENELGQATNYIQTALHLIKIKRATLQFESDQFEFGDFVEEAFKLATDIYYETFQRLGQPESLESLFEVAELYRTQSLLKNLKQQGIESFAGVTETLKREEEEIQKRERNSIHDLARQFALKDKINVEFYQEQLTELKELEKDKARFLDSLQRNLPDYFQLKYSQTLVNTSQIQQIMSPEGLMIEYAEGEKELYILGITERGKFAIKTSAHETVAKQVALLRNQLRYKLQDELEKTANGLYKILIAPVDSIISRNRRPIKELLIIPEGNLTVLPFELLTDRSKKASRFLIEKYKIYYNYSATLHWQKTTDRVSDLSRGLVGFAPVFGSNQLLPDAYREETIENFQFSELPESKSEVDFIAKLYEQRKFGKSQVFNARADESTFKKLEFSQVSLVHLATHGFAGLQGPRSSGVAFGRGATLAEDNILFSEEVYAMHIPVELITLSACETGLGRYQSGEGLVGLTRAFFYAGTRAVLVSMWKVQDASTAELMKSFYQSYLNKSHTKSDALRIAKLNMIRSEKYKHPFYWSAFVLLGAN